MTTDSDKNDLYRLALDVLAEPVLIYDAQRVVYANEAACRLLRADELSSLIGMSVRGFILPELADINDARRAYVLEEEVQIDDLPMKIRGLDGAPLVLRVNVRPLRVGEAIVAMATLSL
jgi:PAS domain S-box-containing protein